MLCVIIFCRTKKRITSRKEFIKEMKKRFKGKYSYKFGNRYPGVVLGHKTCKADGGAVPPYMGWLWNVEIPGINKVRCQSIAYIEKEKNFIYFL